MCKLTCTYVQATWNQNVLKLSWDRNEWLKSALCHYQYNNYYGGPSVFVFHICTIPSLVNYLVDVCFYVSFFSSLAHYLSEWLRC